MVIGQVIRVQTPMYMTFNEDEVEFLVASLADSLNRSYEIIDFFLPREDEQEEEW